jgi:serine/threonine protein kinase HipA of HipAB toxin-antitoxin module
VNLPTIANVTTLRSHRPGEATEHYIHRLARARLKRSELREIDTIYARLDAERAAVGLPSAERAPWSPVDILEWLDLTPTERYLDPKGYADAGDRAARCVPANHLLAA